MSPTLSLPLLRLDVYCSLSSCFCSSCLLPAIFNPVINKNQTLMTCCTSQVHGRMYKDTYLASLYCLVLPLHSVFAFCIRMHSHTRHWWMKQNMLHVSSAGLRGNDFPGRVRLRENGYHDRDLAARDKKLASRCRTNLNEQSTTIRMIIHMTCNATSAAHSDYRSSF